MDILLGFVRLVEGIAVAVFAYRAQAWYMKRYANTNPTGDAGFLGGLFLACLSLIGLEYLTGIADRGPFWPWILGNTNVIAFQSGICRGRREHA